MKYINNFLGRKKFECNTKMNDIKTLKQGAEKVIKDKSNNMKNCHDIFSRNFFYLAI